MGKKKKIKILMVLGRTGRGGAQIFVLNVLRGIDKERFHIDVAVYEEMPEGIGDDVRKLGGNVYIYPRFKVSNWYYFNRFWNHFFTKHQFDIVHGHLSSAASIYLGIARKHGCVTIAHSHSAGYRGGFFVKQVKRLFTFGAKYQADYWFSCSSEAAVRLFGKQYAQNENYYNIPNMIHTESCLFNDEMRRRIRQSIGVNDMARVYGHVGTFTAPKNHVFLLDVFKVIHQKDKEAILLLVGDGVLKSLVENKAQSLGLTDNIRFTGSVPNPHDYMMAMDTMIFPSLFEGFPITVLESQATGLYTLISDTITKEVLLSDCVVPMSIIKKSFEEWADKASRNPIQDRKKYNQIIKQTKYDLNKSILKLEELYSMMVQ